MSGAPALDALLSDEGWAYASTPPVEAGDPGRYHALFGRDSLITALQVLPARPEVARATLRRLAALQGERHDPEVDEEPGKILHEWRPQAPAWHTEHGWPVRDGELRYYGSADSTPWFLVVLAALGDAALERRARGRLARRRARGSSRRSSTAAGSSATGRGSAPAGSTSRAGATSWARRASDATAAASSAPTARRRSRRSPTPTSSRSPTRRCARSPSCRARRRGTRRAEALAERIATDFGPGVMALEGDGLAVPGPGSQLGWLLWSGALQGEQRDAVAARLCEPDVLTAYGLRTLAALDADLRPPELPPRQRLAVRLAGSAGAGCAPPAATTTPSACAPACWRRSTSSATRPSSTRSRAEGELEPSRLTNQVQAWTVGARWALEHDWDGRPAWL